MIQRYLVPMGSIVPNSEQKARSIVNLSPEDKARIEAEERYRQEVRQGLSGTTPGSLRGFAILFISVLSALILIGFAYYQGRSSRDEAETQSANRAPLQSSAVALSPKRSPSFTFVDESRTLTNGQFIVKPGQVVYFRFKVTPEMYDARLVGRFQAVGGTGNDIAAALFSSEDEYQNWLNGHEASVRWSSEGRKTTASCNRPLMSGDYLLAFSNKHSLLTEKQVFGEFDLRYRRKVVAE